MPRCHAARKTARCPPIANFTLLAIRGAACYCVRCVQSQCGRFWAAVELRSHPGGGKRKAPAAQQGGAGLHSRTDGRTTKEEREARPSRAREAPSKRGRAVALLADPSRPRAPRRPIYARRRFGAAPRSLLCASFYRGGSGRNAAATQPATDARVASQWAAPRRNRSSSRRRPRSGIFESN